MVLAELDEPGRPIGRLVHLVALVLEGETKSETDRVIVLHEQQRIHEASVPRDPIREEVAFCYTNRTERAPARHRTPAS
jgi:hypothetical protein